MYTQEINKNWYTIKNKMFFREIERKGKMIWYKYLITITSNLCI